MANPRMQVSEAFARIQSPELVTSTNAWLRSFFGVEGDPGYYEGDTCCRNGCAGEIDTHPSDNCSCHLSAPCSSCTAPRNFCPECGWEESEDPEPYEPPVRASQPIDREWWTPRTLADLDPSRIDYIDQGHTHMSMIKEGVYPEGTDLETLMERIRGTFGGRFEYHYRPADGKPGRFKYIAYTD